MDGGGLLLALPAEGGPPVLPGAGARRGLLLDYRKSTEDNPDNNCDEYNRGYLRKTARALGVPVIRFAARHEGMSDREAAELTPDEFNGLMPELELCEGARVLLTHNLAVSTGS